MNIYVNRNQLSLAVQKVTQYSKFPTSLEILKWMRVDPFEDGDRKGLLLTCSQIEITVTMFVPAIIDGELAPFCVDAKKIKKVLRATRGIEIGMFYSSKPNTLEIACDCGKLTLLCEDASKFVIGGMERWNEFKPEDFTPAGELVNLSKRVGFCTSKDEERPVLQGVCFGDDSVAATDGFRIGFIEKNPTGFTGLIPMESVTAMNRLITQEAEFFKDEKAFGLYIRDANVRIYSYLIDGNFPEYKAIVPKKRKLTAYFSAKDLKEALQFAQVVYNGAPAKAVLLEFRESIITIKSEDYDFGEIKTEIGAAVDFDNFGNDEEHFFRIGFNGDMLLSYMYNSRGSEMSLSLYADNQPGLFAIESDEFKYVVMPVHLG